MEKEKIFKLKLIAGIIGIIVFIIICKVQTYNFTKVIDMAPTQENIDSLKDSTQKQYLENKKQNEEMQQLIDEN